MPLSDPHPTAARASIVTPKLTTKLRAFKAKHYCSDVNCGHAWRVHGAKGCTALRGNGGQCPCRRAVDAARRTLLP